MAPGLYASFRSWCLVRSAITDVVGDDIFMMEAPQEITRPVIVVRIISTVRTVQQSTPHALVMGRLQVDLIGHDSDQLDDLAQIIRLDLNGYRGTAGANFWQSVTLENERHDWLDRSRRFVMGFDALINWNERA